MNLACLLARSLARGMYICLCLTFVEIRHLIGMVGGCEALAATLATYSQNPGVAQQACRAIAGTQPRARDTRSCLSAFSDPLFLPPLLHSPLPFSLAGPDPPFDPCRVCYSFVRSIPLVPWLLVFFNWLESVPRMDTLFLI